MAAATTGTTDKRVGRRKDKDWLGEHATRQARYEARKTEQYRRMHLCMTEFATNPIWGAEVNAAAGLAIEAVRDAVKAKRSPLAELYNGRQYVDPL